MRSANKRFLLLCAGWLLITTGACELAIGDNELSQLRCEQEGAIGPPACAPGQYCMLGQCSPCAAEELCSNELDDDCNYAVDDGCESREDGGNKDSSIETGGNGGVDSAAGGWAGTAGGQNTGGAAGQGGTGGNQGGAAGAAGSSGGSAGAFTGGSAGAFTGGAAGTATGGSAGTVDAGTCDIQVVNAPTCDACLKSSCFGQCVTCSGNSDCMLMIDCVWDCGGDDTCVGPCSNQYPLGSVDYAGLRACLNTDCASQCASCGAIGSTCSSAGECCNGYCCQTYSKNTCRKNNGSSCSNNNECCTDNCWYGYCSY